jgi:hypothetical protein
VGVIPACSAPIDALGRITITTQWATTCFLPSYRRAFAMWGANASAIVHEIVAELLPSMAMPPTLGAEVELRRRIELAVAVLQNQAGIPTRFPAQLELPKPRLPSAAPWLRALLTGWAR